MCVSIYGIDGVPISDSDVEHVQRFDQLRRTFPGVPDDEAERPRAAAPSA